MIDEINRIKELIKKNDYGNDKLDSKQIEQKSFFMLQEELYFEFKKIYNKINKKDFKEFEADSTKISRENSIYKLKEELEYYSDYSEPSTIEYIESFALFTEMLNNMSHVIEESIKKNNLFKDKNMKAIKNSFYDIKTIGLDKIAKNALGKEDEGIIVGTETDDYKLVNKKVLVLDLPRYGQLSWHYNNKLDSNSILNIEKLPTYRYKMQKGVMDSRETSLNSKLLLGQGHINDLNIHNKIDRKIPFGHESELKLALDIYYDILNNKEEYATYESKLRGACLRHGIPSKETFDMILDRVMDTMFGKVCYQREKLEKWRDNIENER